MKNNEFIYPQSFFDRGYFLFWGKSIDMSKLSSLYRQLEIIQLSKKGPFTWDKLERRLMEKSEGADLDLMISKRTLSRDLIEIDRLFGLSIKFDYSSGSYFLNKEESSENHLELLEAFETIQAFGRSSRLRGKVFFENRLARGTEYLKPILEAIEEQEAIQIDYEKYWLWELENRTIRPIALKEYQYRWYVMAWNEKDELRFFGLDRIKLLETLPGKVTLPPAPDLECRFLETIGIINNPDEPVETVILTFTEFKGRYIQSMPLHLTQEILINDKNILQISLRVKINHELIALILSHGDEVKVEEPVRLKEMVREKVKKILEETIK